MTKLLASGAWLTHTFIMRVSRMAVTGITFDCDLAHVLGGITF
jgi:hypothetical protein